MKNTLTALFLLSSACFCDVLSTDGKIRFDTQMGGQAEMTLNSTGLGIGVLPSSNLHVAGNAITSDQLFVGGSSGSSNLNVNGTIGYGIQTVSANATLGESSVVLVNSSSDNITLTLPYAGNVTGRTYQIKKISTFNSVWISGGSNLIDDTSPIEFSNSSSSLPSVKLVSDGVQWFIIESKDLSATVASDNLVGWWKLDELTGSIASDSSSQSNHGTLNNGLTVSGDEGKIGLALDFEDSSTEYVSISDHSSLNFGATFSVSLWMKIESITPWNALVAKDSWDAGEGWVLYIAADGDIRFAKGGYPSITASTPTPLDTWIHVSCSINNGNVEIFINGSSTATGTANVIDTSVELYLGARHLNNGTGTNDHFDGLLDDIRIYNKPLTATEVQAIYNQRQ
jgi:hypothetical protein